MKTGQLLEYNLRNFFLEKSYTKCGGETIPSPFLKNQNWAYLWINVLKFYSFCFYCLLSWGPSKWSKFSCRLFAFNLYKAFGKNKERHGTILPASFSTWFPKKNISLVIFYYVTKFQCLITFTFRYWAMRLLSLLVNQVVT